MNEEEFELFIKKEYGFEYAHTIDSYEHQYYSELYPHLFLTFDSDDKSFKITKFSHSPYTLDSSGWYYPEGWEENYIRELIKELI